MPLTLHSVTFDCENPTRLARFWAAALGYEIPPYTEADIEWLRKKGIENTDDDPAMVANSPDGGTRLLFLQVPEGKAVKNRVHLDVTATTTMREEVDRLVGLGATLDRVVEEDGGTWTVMLDPEGNEFCVERSQAEREASQA